MSRPPRVSRRPCRQRSGPLRSLETDVRPVPVIPPAAREICSPGPHVVPPGSTTILDLKVTAGMRVQGKIRSNLPFDFVIVDERNLVLWEQRKEAMVEQDGEGQTDYYIDKWEVPSAGPWFLVLEGYRKREPRRVRVHLRPVSETLS